MVRDKAQRALDRIQGKPPTDLLSTPRFQIFKRLAGTRWANDKNIMFEWRSDCRFFRNGREVACAPVDDRRVIFAASTLDFSLFEFNRDFTQFTQYSPGQQPNELSGKFVSKVALNRITLHDKYNHQQNLLENLAGTSWTNSANEAFEWKADGSLLRRGTPCPFVPLNAYRGALIIKNYHIDIIEFNPKLMTFQQFAILVNRDGPFLFGKRQ